LKVTGNLFVSKIHKNKAKSENSENEKV